jgi:hypothetical protein
MAPDAYEGGRPSQEAAPRNGDVRIVASPHWRGPDDYEGEIERLLDVPPQSPAGAS